MTSFEHDPPSEEDASDLGDLGFIWGEGYETEQFSPTDEELINEVTVPIRRPRARTLRGELTVDFQNRLQSMRVEDPWSATIWKVRRLENLYWHLKPYSLEDVHYEAYTRLKNEARVPYVSVRYNDVVQAMPLTEAQLDVLQNTQTSEAYSRLVDLGIKHNELRRMARGNDDEQFLLRSLDRLLQEPYLSELVTKLPEEASKRVKNPLEFEEAAHRAVKTLMRKYDFHINHPITSGGGDAELWYNLELRSLERAASFARPLADYLQQNA